MLRYPNCYNFERKTTSCDGSQRDDEAIFVINPYMLANASSIAPHNTVGLGGGPRNLLSPRPYNKM